MIERRYRIAAEPSQVDAARTVPPRPEAERLASVYWDFPDDDLAEIPALRRWLLENGVTQAWEHGLVEAAEPQPIGGEPYSVMSLPWTSWKGSALTIREPCLGCGLPIAKIGPPAEITSEAIDDVLEKLADAPLCFLSAEDCYVATSEFVAAVDSAGLASGLATRSLDGAGQAHLMWSDAPLGGPAYPYGPQPCAVCGRAAETFRGKHRFRWPNYAYRLTYYAELAHWSWSTVSGQTMTLVSQAVAEFLHEHVPDVEFRRSGRPSDPDAFLPEQYRAPS